MVSTDVRASGPDPSTSSVSIKVALAAGAIISAEEVAPHSERSLVEQLRNDENLKRCLRVKRASMLCLAAALDSGFSVRGTSLVVSALALGSLNGLCVVQSPESKTSSSDVSVEEPDIDDEKKEEESTLKSILRTDNRSPRRRASVPKAVRWDRLKIDDHAIVLGYNPGGMAQKGPSLEIGPDVLDMQITTIDEFEATRGPRRTVKQLRSSSEDREQKLLRAGYNTEEIQLAAELAQAIRWSREKSAQDFSILPQPSNNHTPAAKQLQASGNTTTSIGTISKKGEQRASKRKSVFRLGMFYR